MLLFVCLVFVVSLLVLVFVRVCLFDCVWCCLLVVMLVCCCLFVRFFVLIAIVACSLVCVC